MDISRYKQKLLDEQKLVEAELGTVGRKNPDHPGEWEAQVKDDDTASTEADEKADKFEEYEENSSILDTLESRLRDIQTALQKIQEGTYGMCDAGGEQIEEERLEANPAARTCEKHM